MHLNMRTGTGGINKGKDKSLHVCVYVLGGPAGRHVCVYTLVYTHVH